MVYCSIPYINVPVVHLLKVYIYMHIQMCYQLMCVSSQESCVAHFALIT